MFLYNLAAAAGWAYVLSVCIKHIFFKETVTTDVWTETEKELKIVQTMAALEVVHAMVGLVGSGVVTTFMQVFSRVWTLWAVMNITPYDSYPYQTIFYLLAVTSWSLVEVPRYLFYATELYGICPYALKWIRYSLFAVLYPTGISGELGSMYFAYLYLKDKDLYTYSIAPGINVSLYLFIILVALTYIPGSPTMYNLMRGHRNKALKEVKEKAK